jgi:hypothetical protein
LVLAAPISLAEDDCSATAEATLVHEEDSHLQFEVEITTGADRAEIKYDLVIEIELPNGDAKKIKKPGVVKVLQGSETAIVEHKLADGESMLSYEAKIVDCKKQ